LTEGHRDFHRLQPTHLDATSRPSTPCGSPRANSVSRRMTAQDQAAGGMASNWAEAFAKLQGQDTLVQRRSAAARASTRVEALQEVVVQDWVADRPASPTRTSILAEAVEKLRRLQARGEQSRTIAAHARARRGRKQPTPSWEELEDELRRSQEALRGRVAVASRPGPAEPARAPAASPAPNDPPLPPSERLGARVVATVRARQKGAREG
jgi:hypothetical protein